MTPRTSKRAAVDPVPGPAVPPSPAPPVAGEGASPPAPPSRIVQAGSRSSPPPEATPSLPPAEGARSSQSPPEPRRAAPGSPDPVTAPHSSGERGAARGRASRSPAGGERASRRRASTATSSPPAGSTAMAVMAAAMSEDDLEEQVQALCKDLGILRFHNPDSRKVRERGLPDDILIGPRGVLWRELKNMKRKLTPEQEQVGKDLLENDQDWAVWRPVHLLSGQVVRELRDIARPVFARGGGGGVR